MSDVRASDADATTQLEAALEALGLRCTVERRGSLAVLTPVPGNRALERRDVRREALTVLRAHGFTHAAVEVEAAGAGGGDRR